MQALEHNSRTALLGKELICWPFGTTAGSIIKHAVLLQQSEMHFVQQSRKLSVGRGSSLLPLADSNTDSFNADMRTVQ